MRGRLVLIVLVVVAASCGGSDKETVTPSAASSGSATPAPTSASATAPTTLPTTTLPATTSSPATTSPGGTSVLTTVPVVPASVTLGAPDPALRPASPPDEIEWSEVGAGWLLIDYVSDPGRILDATALDQRGLYLVAPDDSVYGVSALPTDGSSVAAVSTDGRQVLLEQYDLACADGCECPTDSAVESQSYGFALLDLTTTTTRPVIDPVTRSVCDPSGVFRHVQFSADGRGIWVWETSYDDRYQPTQVRISRVEASAGGWSTILDEPVVVDETAAPTTWDVWGAIVVETIAGRIVTASPSGIWLREADGTPIRALDQPETSCELVRAWGADTVLARCGVPAGEFPPPPEVPATDCNTRGLWLIPTDGSPARTLAVSLDERGYLICWSDYTDAAPLDDWLAVQVGGDGCSDDVVLISADGIATRWTPPGIPDSCTESLIGVRNGAWLLRARAETGDGGFFEATSEGSTQVNLPPGEIFVLGP